MVSPSSDTGALSLRSNDFELFGLSEAFDLDLHAFLVRLPELAFMEWQQACRHVVGELVVGDCLFQ